MSKQQSEDRISHLQELKPYAWGIPLVLFILVVGSLYLAHELLFPVFLSILLALTLSPAVAFLVRIGIPRLVSSLSMIVLSVAISIGLIALAGPSLYQWLDDAPTRLAEMLHHDPDLKDTVETLQDASNKVNDAVNDLVQPLSEPALLIKQESLLKQLLTLIQRFVGVTLLVVTLSLFLLSNGDRLILNLIHLSKDKALRRKSIRLFRRLRVEVGRYLGTAFMVNVAAGGVTSLMTWALGAPLPWIWLVLVAFFRFIPYIGVAVVASMMACVTYIETADLMLSATQVLLFFGLMTLTGMIIDPWVHGLRLKVNPVIVFLSVLFWGWLWGAAGAVIAVPMLTIVLVCAETMEWKTFSHIVTSR